MKNIKKFIVCLFTIISTIVMLNLVACSETSEEAPTNKKFNSFSTYENFSDGVVAVEVTWDLLGSFCEFTIDDTEQISHIIKLYNQTYMKKIGKEPTAGENGSIKFVYHDGTKISASLFIIYDNETECYYSYPDTTIYDYIEQIGKGKKVIL